MPLRVSGAWDTFPEDNNMTYFELTPAYGRDYQLGFKPVNKADIPKPCTVNLRYKGNRSVAVVKVS